MPGLTLSQQFAEALHPLRGDLIPAAVIHAAQRTLLDTLGAGLAGCGTPEVERALAAAASWHEQGPSTVWGRSERLSAPHAALLNGTMAHAREVDDFSPCGHTSAVVVPAVLAVAETVHPSGRDLLTAMVWGYEAADRVVELLGGYANHNDRLGWHGTGTCGVFGAAAAVSYLLGLDPEQLAHALGLAGSYTGGIWSFIANGAMSKRLHAGKAAETGLVAACLAQQGFTGPTHIFEREWGSFTTLYGGDYAVPEALLEDFGREFYIFRSGFKPYACCRSIHGSIEAALSLRSEHNLSVSQVERVLVHACDGTNRRLGKQQVESLLDAQMSLPYCLAVALTSGAANLEQFQPPYLYDPAVRALACRVTVLDEPWRPQTPQTDVELHLKDGRVLSGTVADPKGKASNPMSDAELEAKFMSLARLTLSPERAEQLRDLAWDLDRQGSTDELCRLMGDAGSRTAGGA